MDQVTNSSTSTTTVDNPTDITSTGTTQEINKDDIIARASKFIDSNKPKDPIIDKVDFNSQELDKLLEGVTDPVIKEQLIKKSKSLESGFNRKFMELANIRKEYEGRINQDQEWTPEKVQSLLQRPDFIKSAQAIVPSTPPEGMTTEEYSMLSDVEKQKLASMEQKLGLLENERMQALRKEEDTRLMSKYTNYKSEAVDSIMSDMMTGKIQATREHLWKVYDYDDAVVRAYKMGMSDRNNQNQERVNASVVPSGASVVPNSDLKPNNNETGKAFFMRVAKQRLAESKQMAGAKQ